MSVICPQCGGNKFDYNQMRIPGDLYGGYKIVAKCLNCLTVFTINQDYPRTIPSPSVPSDKPAIPFAIHSAIVDALDYAKSKHPRFADSDAEIEGLKAEITRYRRALHDIKEVCEEKEYWHFMHDVIIRIEAELDK